MRTIDGQIVQPISSLLCTLLLASSSPTVKADDGVLGFDNDAAEVQKSLEKQYDKNILADDLDNWLKYLSARPHHAGSKASKQNAEYLAELFRSWGYATTIDEYEILLPTPRNMQLDLIRPTRFSASLEEQPLAQDASTLDRDDLLAPYNAFSVDGDVEGELVFVNYGRPEDYELLERYGIDVAGKIAIAKYGKAWRGIKPKLAGENGAIGTIIYSDPADDGYVRGDTYPEGAFKHASAVERGSVLDIPSYPGDVLTPGIGAIKGAKRLSIEDAPTITKIPVMPISSSDALTLLSAMDGPVVPDDWRGGLPITYHFGPGPAVVRMNIKFNWDEVAIYNVIARLKGNKFPDEWIIRGNHHDAWNHGAADPGSALVAMLAEAKSVGQLFASGVQPARTIIYAAWDSEEPGLMGSTEWAEHHANELKSHAIAYINTDTISRGFVNVGGSHTLERFFNQILEDVIDPQTNATIKDRLRARLKLFGPNDEDRKEATERDGIRLDPLGSGSDFTPFLQHLGIASANIYFDGEGDDGSYHTLYDTYRHYTTWRDPGLAYSVALAKVGGRATLRLANAQLLPFDFIGFADNVEKYVGELEALADEMREATEITNEMIANGAYALALNPNGALQPPKLNPSVPFFNFSPLKNALVRLENAANAYSEVADDYVKSADRSEINFLLYTSERLLTRDAGLRGRPWYKHHIYAPGFYTGYGVKTIPGVREALEARNFDQVAPEIELAAQVLNDIAQRIEKIIEGG